ncbi:hypothetical protein AQ727_02485, partial [Burkholderia pseudomallei]
MRWAQQCGWGRVADFPCRNAFSMASNSRRAAPGLRLRLSRVSAAMPLSAKHVGDLEINARIGRKALWRKALVVSKQIWRTLEILEIN